MKPLKTLTIEIDKDNYERAITAASGGCIVADAIKEQYPQFSRVRVDVATVRVTDRERGQRYIYLTPPAVVDTLLYFDQGFREKSLPKTLRIRQLVRVEPITRSESTVKGTAERRIARLTELEAKEKAGVGLTGRELRSLAMLRNPKESVKRPRSYGSATSAVEDGHIVTRGGMPMKPAHPNMLATKTRHFGEKMAEPSKVFKEAVKEAVKADRAKREKSKK